MSSIADPSGPLSLGDQHLLFPPGVRTPFDDYVRACMPAGKPVDVRAETATGWIKPVSGIAPELVVAAGLIAGVRRAPVDIKGLVPAITGAAAKYALGQRTPFMDLDLDGGYDPRAVLDALRRLGIVPAAVTTGSGKPGRYHAYFRIELIRIDEMIELMGAALDSVGFPLRGGHAELYPRAAYGRLPGCTSRLQLFDATLTRARVISPLALAGKLLRAAPIDLRAVCPIDSTVSRRRRSSRCTARASTAARDEAERLLREGASAGERHLAYQRLAWHCFTKGLDLDEAVTTIREWVGRGGIAATRGSAREDLRGLKDRVRHMYSGFMTFRPRREPPAHLTRREIAAAVQIVCAAVDDPDEQAVVGVTALQALAVFKAYRRAGRRRVYVTAREWERMAGGVSWAAHARDASGLFVVGRYATAAAAGDAAHPIAYRVAAFAFDEAAPRRCLWWQPRRGSGRQGPSGIKEVRRAWRSAISAAGLSGAAEHAGTTRFPKETREHSNGIGGEPGSPPDSPGVRNARGWTRVKRGERALQRLEDAVLDQMGAHETGGHVGRG